MAEIQNRNFTTEPEQLYAKLTAEVADLANALKGCDGSGVALKVSSKTTEATDPGDRSFDNPSLRYDLEADCGIKSLDDLYFPVACSSCGCSRFCSLVAAVGENAVR